MKVTPFLMFMGQAEEALNFYVSLFPESGVERMERYGPEGPGKEGTIKLAAFTLAGQRILCIDSYVKHDFTFTPAMSLFVDFDGEEPLRATFDQLAEGGQVLMPVDNYGFSRLFTWVQDRFGVSWQLNVP